MLKVGIIGAGRIGKVHTESITKYVPNAEVKAIADPFMNDATAEWARTMGVKETHKDYKAILNDPEIEAVLVCSSTDTHSQISRSEEHTSELQSRQYLVCRLLLEKKPTPTISHNTSPTLASC